MERALIRPLFRCAGGEIVLPSPELVLVSREDGGNLIVNPTRDVWERGELTPQELVQWSFLVAAAGAAMLDSLPQLDGGCINYWEAGNWSLNEAAPPAGPKPARGARRVHLHLLGRSPRARSAAWRWGEAPKFPDYADRLAWSAGFTRLRADECSTLVERVDELLRTRYGTHDKEIAARAVCRDCGYPSPVADLTDARCNECARTAIPR